MEETIKNFLAEQGAAADHRGPKEGSCGKSIKPSRSFCLPNFIQCYYATFALPLADESVDLLLAQNTMPCFSEFARVCRPGGIVVYVDNSASWIIGLAKRLVEKHRLFE